MSSEKIDKIDKIVKESDIGFLPPKNSAEKIKSLEENLGVELPQEYADFLGKYGWLDIGEGLLSADVALKEAFKLQKYYPQTFPQNLIPLDENGSGDYACLVCGGVDHGKVVFWRHDVPDYFVYPNIPDEDWFKQHPDWAKNHINGKKEDFWLEAPDFWTWLLNRLELKKQTEEDEF